MDSKQGKNQIEAIYPLTEMQRNLLFHHLSSNEDSGLLHVEFEIEGNLDIETFKSAWVQSAQRHPVLRSSVHWKKIAKPVLLTKEKISTSWTELDWRKHSHEDQLNLLVTLKKKEKLEDIALDNSPLAKVTIIRTANSKFTILWLCHHILLDGWSTSIIIEDTFKTYQSIKTGVTAEFKAIPSYKSYLHWQKSYENNGAEAYWSNTFTDLKEVNLIEGNKVLSQASYKRYEKSLDHAQSNGLKQVARKNKISINALLQGAYALVLAKYFNNDKIVYGTTVSGRSIDFPNIHLMSGMFVNELPVHPIIEKSQQFVEYFKQLQKQFLELRNHETATTNQILQWANIQTGAVLYDSLFIFENFPWDNLDIDELKINGFKSGITSTYPLTFLVNETDVFELIIMTNSALINESLSKWFMSAFEQILSFLIKEEKVTVGEVLFNLESPVKSTIGETEAPVKAEDQNDFDYIPPTTTEELQLSKIWESVLGLHPISVDANFFELGGKSIHALRMFTRIEKELSIKRIPTLLIENPTIRSLAKALFESSSENQFKYLVPIKSKGSKAPLFCIHAGGGHVFFYKPLSDEMPMDRPVFGVQSSGISNYEEIIGDVEQMAQSYIEEMRLVQPKGVLNVLVYCFSTAVGVEMASYLEKRGEQINLIVMDTASQHSNFKWSYRKLRLYGFISRIVKNPFKAIYLVFKVRHRRAIQKVAVATSEGKQEIKTEKVRIALQKAHENYNWKKIKSDIWLILLPSVNKMYNPFIIKTWKDLVHGKVKIVHVKGITHFDAFDYPNVSRTAEFVEKCIEN